MIDIIQSKQARRTGIDLFERATLSNGLPRANRPSQNYTNDQINAKMADNHYIGREGNCPCLTAGGAYFRS